MKVLKCSLVIIAALFAAQSAYAHHSSAMFDFTKKIQFEGVVKEWQYTNPHCWLIITVTKSDGTTEDWALEGGNPGLSSNLTRSTFKRGQKVTAITNPMRDGRKAGKLSYIRFADGRVWEAPSVYGARR